VGELGWELYISSDQCGHIFETIIDAGSDHDLKLCGMHMMDSCRIEKAYRHFGHDITCEDHVLEAGLGFAVDTDKPDFIGKKAVINKREVGLEKRLVQFQLTEPEPLLYHNEPIIRDSEIVGYISSGNYGHKLGGAIGMGYIPCEGESPEELLSSKFEIDVSGTICAAKASLKPLYDPLSKRTKA
jgi:4-methylaminobutanoate oxidase (formaldehyde-forming)